MANEQTSEVKPMAQLRTCEHYIVHDNGDISFTRAGKAYYLPYFQKLGIDLDSINSVNRLITAKRSIRPLVLEDMENELANRSNSLENRWLLSLLQGDLTEFHKLDDLIQRKSAANMKIVR